ncbi:glyoxylase-like metal-dependent hydrolase (beta-lactamase superfamily II) [Roseibium hamelinense]|uniref:Glyoxylase-like metal-dependent hydrolase (Beta-lactamase superfamily II) n=1 Tax=Roseibium hamelinense TaxID=150831 RepID=A0A562STM1_9HYPH|nr:MBL fold metallo-hydrolase [Roseibium hamelinense]MTI42715.1 MBL fold metallo-hydrolase [Roseibium hamelinense]TWI84595.1 glyoxylase-like metal-dependent hydrolase (beta-lactamase superfamily II) [Roseibium hamelinense]
MRHTVEFDPHYGNAVEVADGVRRLTAKNPGPFTFHGTNTYLVGTQNIVVVDPGPDDPAHVDAIMKAVAGAHIAAIFVSHTHMDHSPAARRLQEKSGAPIVGCGPHSAARDLAIGEDNLLDASADKTYSPDQLLTDGNRVVLGDAEFEALDTPGHTANHMCFALTGTNILFSADHVMAWSTSIVAPPDGSMNAYMMSLEKLILRPETHYLPGHGTDLQNALPYVEDLIDHRKKREAAVVSALSAGAKKIPQIVDHVYVGLNPKLKTAASLSVFAQLEWLVDKGEVITDGPPRLDGLYRIAD